jgi:N-methylhydantoinase B/oxoprolinase/acetone carboxylase alpha subunit
LQEFLADYDLDDLDKIAEDILTRSEAAMRLAIGTLPEGIYRAALDVDGYREPVHVAVTVTIQKGTITTDFAGSSPEREDTSINCVLNTTFADVYYAFKCSLAPRLPNNEGLTRPILVKAPAGSIFNTRFPRAVRSRSKISFHIHAAIYRALAEVIPDRVQAGSGSFWSLTIFGTGSDSQPFRVHMLPNGGKGAVRGRDGLPTIAFPYNGTATPVEILENNAPILIGCRELLPDSGGAGEYRGGLGQRLTLLSLESKPVHVFVRPDKLRFPAPGLLGGRSGMAGAIRLNGQPAPPGTVALRPGDCIELLLPGGGGFGDAGCRDSQALLRDLAEGYITRQGAQDHYRFGTESLPQLQD